MPSGKRGVIFGDLCKGCKVPLTIDNSIFKAHRLGSCCKNCEKTRHDSRLSRTKEARKATYISWKFGLSIEEYNKKLELQLNGCAICKQPCVTGRGLAIDHDHKTGVVRDLLCIKCNALVGYLEEDENRIINAVEYIKRHSQRKVA